MRAPHPTGMATPEPTPRSSLALRQIALLEGLSDQRLDLLAQQCLWHSVEAGKPLLLRAEQQGEVFLLVSGRVRVTTYSANGRQVTFRDAEAGQYFGDIAAIDGRPRSADVVTLAPSVVASLDHPAFMALLRDESLVAEWVMKRLASLVRQLSERVIDLSTLGVQNRLHAKLLRLARVAGVDDNQARLEPAPKHAALASQISTNREQVTRELNVLVRSGVLRKDGKALLVADAARLERMLAGAGRRRLSQEISSGGQCASADAEATRAQQHHGQRAEQVQALQFQRPAALLAQREQVGHVHEAEGHEHVDDDHAGSGAGPEAGDHQQRRRDFAHVHEVGQPARQAGLGQHAADETDAGRELEDAVQQHEHADRHAQQQLARVVQRGRGGGRKRRCDRRTRGVGGYGLGVHGGSLEMEGPSQNAAVAVPVCGAAAGQDVRLRTFFDEKPGQ